MLHVYPHVNNLISAAACSHVYLVASAILSYMATLLNAKEQQQTVLNEELGKIKMAMDEEREKAKTEVMSSMENVLEEELICSICSELLIEVRTS